MLYAYHLECPHDLLYGLIDDVRQIVLLLASEALISAGVSVDTCIQISRDRRMQKL